ncbi:MAG: GHKL domain-containing protein [Lachnospiraceae bacterium]|nr:GHKL domain-containing protein [Lachnospiraceae bacterium]
MKHSIRKQFAGIFIGMMAATVSFTWLINTIFLDDYYLNEKQKNLIQVYETLNKAEKTGQLDSEDFYNITMSNLCSRYNITGLVVDIRTQKLLAFGADEEQSKRRLWDSLLFIEHNPQKILQESNNYKMLVITDKISKAEYIDLWGNLENGDMFLLRTPLESIRDSAVISNRFLGYIGIIATMISAMIIWFLSKKYTKPILELAKISQKMARLDFEAKYVGEKDNEIGILGENINLMSMELERTISELKSANLELTKDIERKERNEEMRSEFLANVSHELKTPIALIQGYAEGLKDNVTDSQEEKEYYCDVIIDESRKMNEMVRKLLTLNQLEFGNEIVSMERFNLSELILNYLQFVEILVNQKGASIELPAQIPVFVWADELKVEEVFMNYISNAVHYVKEDALGQKKITVDFEVKEKSVRILVFNTGDSIPEESIPKLWDKFYKVDKARTREYGGNGIGLSIVKAIMESMNGAYGVENKENGVLFWFELERA